MYSFPIKKKDIERISTHSPAHIGDLIHSIDFVCDEGTKIYSAAAGKVVWIRNDSKVGGPHKKYWFKGNRIVIAHKNGEYTAYEHMRYKSSRVKLGQKVRRGQLIALSGNTGYSFGPHLHFEVFDNPYSDLSGGKTKKIRFKK